MVFIPLYPKVPLFDIIPGYIVRVRIEDIVILATAILWLVQVIRGRVAWRTPIFWVIVAYAVVGFLSVLSAVFITETVPFEVLHVGKTVLHYFRYLEYFSLYLILFSAITTKKQVKIVLGLIVATVLAITAYGYGQKEYYWPVYSTMNREFSKGIRLYLTEHARVQSTFGGHYDLSAYLVVMLPLILAMAFMVKQRPLKIALHAAHVLGVWLMIVSASRTSFGAYMVSLVLVIGLFAWQQKTWLKKIIWGSSRGVLFLSMVGIMMIWFGADMYQRFIQILDGYPVASKTYKTVIENQKKLFELPRKMLADQFRMPEVEKPSNSISTEEAEKMVLVASDERPVPNRPSDVYVNVNDIVEVASVSASGSAITVMVDRGPRSYSDCALERGLSLCIRLDTLWPRALTGFRRNPLLGSGYATLTKESIGQFTEAESTDNNFLRTLGETGLLGFVTFYGVVAVGLYYAYVLLKSNDQLGKAVAIGFIASSVGLLLNAVYIDVFAASKVALSYWALLGVIAAYATIVNVDEPIITTRSTKRAARHD